MIYLRLLVALHFATLLILLFIPLPASVILISIVLLAGHCYWAYQGWVKLQAVSRVIIGGNTILLNVEGHLFDVKPVPPMIITFPFILICLKSEHQHWWLPIFRDSASSSDLRGLRVWLNCRPETGV